MTDKLKDHAKGFPENNSLAHNGLIEQIMGSFGHCRVKSVKNCKHWTFINIIGKLMDIFEKKFSKLTFTILKLE